MSRVLAHPEPADVLDLEAASRLLLVSTKCLRRLVKLKRIPAFKVNARGSLRFTRSSILAALEGRKAGAHGN